MKSLQNNTASPIRPFDTILLLLKQHQQPTKKICFFFFVIESVVHSLSFAFVSLGFIVYFCGGFSSYFISIHSPGFMVFYNFNGVSVFTKIYLFADFFFSLLLLLALASVSDIVGKNRLTLAWNQQKSTKAFTHRSDRHNTNNNNKKKPVRPHNFKHRHITKALVRLLFNWYLVK